MSIHQLPPSYDTWRLTPPDDLRRKPRFAPSDVTNPLFIDAEDIQLDWKGTYDADTGALLSIESNGRQISPENAIKALALMGEDSGTWFDDLREDLLADLVQQAAQDAADDYGDYRYEQRRDDE
ncbi:hypothetical protein DEM26_18050 [Thioclava sp. NG1]|uniref:hypothetical protein n=1 Tax=Thioclava sp. NG1 TaxID=2182426 RepID=UPI000D612934|nr:hypothetical protein [Thioclava sp. NG1]PWE48451.1 hypothetical protein DEM26_18050 [Thioclava sp. NG1]